MPVRLRTSDPGFEAGFASLLARRSEAAADIARAARDIVDDVRLRGDQALFEYTRRFDGFSLSAQTLLVSASELAEAASRVPAAALDALRFAASRIESFHRRHLPADDLYTDELGVTLGVRWTPVDAVGLYVPGGLAAYPSSVLMNAIPARLAGVHRIVAVTPAPGGALNPMVLAAASIAGVTSVLRIGGAQAIAALAYGTASVAPVDKIVGPGNAWVAAAKALVFGHVGIDSIAGPSEVLIVADTQNDPSWLAADLLAQAEHDEKAQAILMTPDEALANAVGAEVERQLELLPRAEIARASWNAHGALIVLRDLGQAPELANRIAAEHVQLCVAAPQDLAAKLRHAGAIFLGRRTPEALGDYVAGPNHVLPTSRAARYASGLSVLDFMKRTTLLSCPEGAYDALAGPASVLADAEGLSAHARSLRIRSNR